MEFSVITDEHLLFALQSKDGFIRNLGLVKEINLNGCRDISDKTIF
jgi:hypothetical protein